MYVLLNRTKNDDFSEEGSTLGNKVFFLPSLFSYLFVIYDKLCLCVCLSTTYISNVFLNT